MNAAALRAEAAALRAAADRLEAIAMASGEDTALAPAVAAVEERIEERISVKEAAHAVGRSEKRVYALIGNGEDLDARHDGPNGTMTLSKPAVHALRARLIKKRKNGNEKHENSFGPGGAPTL